MQKYLSVTIFLILIIVSISFGQSSLADSTKMQPNLIGYDKFQHVAVSCLLTLSGQYVLEAKSEVNKNNALLYSTTSSAIIGLTKELTDMQKRAEPFDWGDLLANFAGIGLAVVIITL
jgi:uncharacterized protein YfiM (DUF2279 family)